MKRKLFFILFILLFSSSLFAAGRKAKKITVQIDDDDQESVEELQTSTAVQPTDYSSANSAQSIPNAQNTNDGNSKLFSVVEENVQVKSSESVQIFGHKYSKPFFRFGFHTRYNSIRKFALPIGLSFNFQFIRSNTFHTYAYVRGEYFLSPLGTKTAKLSGFEFNAEPGIGLAVTPFRDTSFRVLFSAEFGWYLQFLEFSSHPDKLVLTSNGMMFRPSVSVETFGLFSRYVEFGVFYQFTFFNSYKDYDGIGFFVRM